jgi:hypothetical protein
MPGSRKTGARHELAHAPDVLGDGRADHRADVVQDGVAAPADRAEVVDDPRHALPQRPALGELCVLDVGGAGVRRADEDEHAGAGGAGALEQRLERVDAEIRAGGERVGAEARDRAERRRRRADERLAVGGRRHGDVAALAVREHEQAGGARVFDDLDQRRPPGRAEALEACELRLGRGARGPGRVDQRPAVGHHRAGRTLGGRPLSGCGVHRERPQPRGVRVEPQDNLGLAPGDDGCQPVGKARPGRRLGVSHGRRGGRRRRGGPRPRYRAQRSLARRAQPLTAFFRPGAGREARHLRGADLDRLAGARVHALTRAALGDVELAEAREGDVAPALEGLLDDVQDGIDGLTGLGLLQVGPAGHLVDEL